MNKKALAIGTILMLLLIPTASATEPVFSSHSDFTGSFEGWDLNPNGTWSISSDYKAEALLNDTIQSASMEYNNWTDLSGINLGQNTEIDFRWSLNISASNITDSTTEFPITFYIYENTTNNELITVKINYGLYSREVIGDNTYKYIWLQSIRTYIEKDGLTIGNNVYTAWSYTLYYYISSGTRYSPQLNHCLYQINYNNKTYWHIFVNGDHQSIETPYFNITSAKPKIVVNRPTFTNDTFTFDLDYYYIDAYAPIEHKELVKTPTQETSFFDIIPLQNLAFAILLISIFILSVSEKVNIPKELGYLSLLTALAVLLFSLINYYTGDNTLSILGGLTPYIGYPLKDKFLNRKMFR